MGFSLFTASGEMIQQKLTVMDGSVDKGPLFHNG
jgi:hypothetical protein